MLLIRFGDSPVIEAMSPDKVMLVLMKSLALKEH